MLFQDFWDKQRNKEPDEPKMISLCKIFEGSGADKNDIIKEFDTYMVSGEDYEVNEKQEMIDYLIEVSKDLE